MCAFRSKQAMSFDTETCYSVSNTSGSVAWKVSCS